MTSKTTVLLVAGFLGLCAIGGIIAIALLAAESHQIPASLETLTGTALGALAMTLGSARSTFGAGDIAPPVMQATVAVPGAPAVPTEVTVVNPASDPVETIDSGATMTDPDRPMLSDLNTPAQ